MTLPPESDAVRGAPSGARPRAVRPLRSARRRGAGAQRRSAIRIDEGPSQPLEGDGRRVELRDVEAGGPGPGVLHVEDPGLDAAGVDPNDERLGDRLEQTRLQDEVDPLRRVRNHRPVLRCAAVELEIRRQRSRPALREEDVEPLDLRDIIRSAEGRGRSRRRAHRTRSRRSGPGPCSRRGRSRRRGRPRAASIASDPG